MKSRDDGPAVLAFQPATLKKSKRGACVARELQGGRMYHGEAVPPTRFSGPQKGEPQLLALPIQAWVGAVV